MVKTVLGFKFQGRDFRKPLTCILTFFPVISDSADAPLKPETKNLKPFDMIIYNVTVKIERSIHGDWVDWMRNVHIPEVMATGYFTKSTMLRLLEPPADEEGITYAIQYTCNNIEALRRYQEEESPALQAKVAERYEGKFFAFRTILKVVE